MSVNESLQAYLAGQVTAAQLSSVVAAEYYRGAGNGTRDTLRPVMDVVERAHPGVVELKASEHPPGFDVRLAERPFPKRYESELRQAVEHVLGTLSVSRVPPPQAAQRPGFLRRIVAALRRVFRP